MTNLAVLWDEINIDPLVEGYSGMTDIQIANAMNVVDKNRNRTSMSGKEVKDQIEDADWDSRTVDQQQILLAMVARDDLDPFGIDQHIFTDAMTGHVGGTVAALAAARVETVSRGEFLGLGSISEGDVIHARTYGL